MKYYYEKPAKWVGAGETYICNHPRYTRCTLFRQGDRGLSVIQERWNDKTRARWWSSIDPWLAGDICMNERFSAFFDAHADICDGNGLYPTVSVRKIMWALRMKPLRREFWEEEFP